MPKTADGNRKVMLAMALGALFLSVFICTILLTTPARSAVVSAGGRTYFVLLATNQQQWVRGLMFYNFSCSYPGMCVNGMLFIFPTTKTECFWMENTPQPLTQIWIDNGTVTDVYRATPESTSSVCAVGNQVLELNSNLPYNITVGSQVGVTLS
jgi:uncharacterized membrane protein (UPF0127 family)